jgi:peptidyl-tRNA hydrolase
MNLSGKAVESFVSKHRNLFVHKSENKDDKKHESDPSRNLNTKQIAKECLLIVHDDLEHKFGNIRIKQKGSAE